MNNFYLINGQKGNLLFIINEFIYNQNIKSDNDRKYW